MSVSTCIQCNDVDRSNQHRLDLSSFTTRYESSYIKDHLDLPRRYTCTYHKKIGSLYIGHDYNKDLLSSANHQSGITGKWIKINNKYEIHFKVLLSTKDNTNSHSRNKSFCKKLSVVLESIANTELLLLKEYPHLGNTRILVYFQSIDNNYDRVENWHSLKYWTQHHIKEESKRSKKKDHLKRPPLMCSSCNKQ
jgi:hypothetical protein